MEGTTKRGLLQLANSLLAKSTPNFDEWAARNGFRHAGIFASCRTEKTASEYYLLSDSIGFSARSIVSSVAEADFWAGKLTRAFEWQCFSKDFNEISPFVELFDSRLNGSIDSLYFLPFYDSEKPMYFVLAELEDEDEVTLPDAEKCAAMLKNIIDYQRNEERIAAEIDGCVGRGLSISPSHLFIMSVKACVEKIMQSVDVERKLSKFDMVDRIEIKDHAIQAVANAAHNIIEPVFKSPNCLHRGTNGEIKIVMYAKDEQDEQVISYHLAAMLTPLLGEDAPRQIILLTAGICPNKNGTLSFLQKG